MRNRMLNLLILLAAAMILSGCAASGTATFKDYTGNAPNGALGTIKLLMDHPDHKGVEVTLTLSGFGNVQNVENQKDVKKVSEELVKFASLYNDISGFDETQYYYTYYSDYFKAGKACKLTLYYLVPPESADENLSFLFNYPTGSIIIDEPCGLFK